MSNNMHFDRIERTVYFSALERFRHGQTYQQSHEPLRTSLQQDYACFVVERFRRENRNQRIQFKRSKIEGLTFNRTGIV